MLLRAFGLRHPCVAASLRTCLPPLARGVATHPPGEVERLQLLVKELLAKVDEKDAIIRVLQMQLAQHGCSSSTVAATEHPDFVGTADDLVRAFEQGMSTITLQSGRCYAVPHKVFVEHKSITMCSSGPEPAVLQGNFKFQKESRIVATNIHFRTEHAGCDAPLLEIAGRSSFCARQCVFDGGRDGINLSASSSADLICCEIRNCVRGVFEGFKCELSVSESTFLDNAFHLVLLGPTQHGHPDRVVALSDAKNRFRSTTPETASRGDVAFKYNPIQDSYDEVYKDGHVIVLTTSEQSTNLVDPTW